MRQPKEEDVPNILRSLDRGIPSNVLAKKYKLSIACIDEMRVSRTCNGAVSPLTHSGKKSALQASSYKRKREILAGNIEVTEECSVCFEAGRKLIFDKEEWKCRACAIKKRKLDSIARTRSLRDSHVDIQRRKDLSR